MRSKYDNRLLEEAYSSVHKDSSPTTNKVLTEGFQPGHGMVPAPIDKGTYQANGLRKLWGIKMRAGKWADTFVGVFDDDSFAIITPSGVKKYPSADTFERAFEKFRTTNTLEESYKNVLSESDDSAGKIPVSAVEDLSFITVADRTTPKWVTWEVSFVYQGQEYTGFLGAVPDHPSEMHDDYIEDAEPVQTPALDEAEESSSPLQLMRFTLRMKHF